MTCDPADSGSRKRHGKWAACWRAIAARLQLPDNSSGLAMALFMGVVGVAGVLAAALFDPVAARWFPKCPLFQCTGLKCPGCGTARALHALARGDWRAAWHYNAILFAAIPFLAALVFRPNWAKRPAVAWGTFAVAVGWMVLRNLLERF